MQRKYIPPDQLETRKHASVTSSSSRTYKLRFLLLLIVIICIVGAAISGVLAYGIKFGLEKATTKPPAGPLIIHNKPLPTLLRVQGKPPTVTAGVAYLYDADSGQTLIDQNGEKVVPMASVTKIMTAIVALRTGDLNQQITVPQAALDHVILNNGSNAGLVAGDKFTLNELLYALMLPSGDDAAYTIATSLAGSTDQYVARMNLMARRLHLFQTHYINPDGLTSTDNQDNLTSAYDLIKLTQYALSIPKFAAIVQTPHFDLPATADHAAYKWKNTNYLLDTSYPGMLGVKTGTTDNAGACLVFYDKRNGLNLIGVVLHSIDNLDPAQDTRYSDTKQLLEWGFKLEKIVPTKAMQKNAMTR